MVKAQRNKLFLGILLLTFAFLIISWFILFEYGSSLVQSKIKDFTTDIQKQGYQFSYSSIEVSGTPFKINVTLKDPKLIAPYSLYSWQGDELILSTSFWKLNTIEANFPGEHKVYLTGFKKSFLSLLEYKGGKVNFYFDSDRKLKTIQIYAQELSTYKNKETLPLLLKKLNIKLDHLNTPQNLSLYLSINFLGVNEAIGLSSDGPGLDLTLDAELTGIIGDKLPHDLKEWRNQGGIFDIHEIKLKWPPILIDGEGTLTLDQNMFPLGSFTAQIKGTKEVLNLLVKKNIIKKKNKKTVSFALQFFKEKNEEGESITSIPITLQNGTLAIGPATLLKLEPLSNWEF